MSAGQKRASLRRHKTMLGRPCDRIEGIKRRLSLRKAKGTAEIAKVTKDRKDERGSSWSALNEKHCGDAGEG
jgi:hypothetical protein